jgi:hypothetical protein
MRGPFARETDIGGQTKQRVTYRIIFNLKIDPSTQQPQGWISHVLLQGPRYFDNANDKNILSFETTDGQPRWGNLNLDGTKRDPSLAGLYVPRNRYKLADFNQLNLGPFA